MSNAGQAGLGIVGAVVGFFVGGPTGAYYGFQIGLLAGSALFPTQLPGMQGPRLQDGQATVSHIGAPIPWLVGGTQKVGGIVIWASPVREVANTETVGGKGGPEQKVTNYSYFRSYAILLSEGPIGGIRSIKANGKIIYDRANRTAGPDETDEQVLAELTQQGALNQSLEAKMVVYLGTEDQMPDPTIESFEGVGNVPAFRGYSYVVFDDVELKQEDGVRMPAQWEFEIYDEGTESALDLTMYSNEVLYEWLASSINPINSLNEHEYEAFRSGLSSISVSGTFDTLPAALGVIQNARDRSFDFYTGYSIGEPGHIGGEPNINVDGHRVTGRAGLYDVVDVFLAYNEFFPVDYSAPGGVAAWCNAPEDGQHHWISVGISGHDTEGAVWIYVDQEPTDPPHEGYDIFTACLRMGAYDCAIRVRRLPSAPPSPCTGGYTIPGVTGWCVNSDGQIVRSGTWVLDESQNYHVLQAYEASGGGQSPTVTKYPLNPAMPVGHDLDTQIVWEQAYDRAVAYGLMSAGLEYGVDYPVVQNFGYKIENDTTLVDIAPVSIATLIQRICTRIGFLDIDTADLENRFVYGYQISRPMFARAAIEPLRSVGFFDVVESATVLKFPTRGKAIAATLLDADLGARFYSEERVPNVTTRKSQEIELPRQIRVLYQNVTRDFEPGEELSPVRVDTAAQSVATVELAVALTPDQAAKVAEVVLRDTWASRWTHVTQLDVSHAGLEPADCIEIPVDSSVHRVRIPSLTDKLPNLRIIELVRDDDGSYVSHAAGTTSLFTRQRLQIAGPVDLILLDLPPLELTDNDAGIYAAMTPLIRGGLFRGASVYFSDDGESTPVSVASVEVAVTAGRIIGTVPSGPTTVFDDSSEITVDLSEGELESATELEVLNGANAAAIGAHGRWNIVQFKNAENVTGTIWRLTGLLQGRRGTEHAVGTSEDGDRFVMLTDGGLVRVPLAVSDIGKVKFYRGVPSGTTVEAATAQEFTANGEALKPFSPVHVQGTRDDDDLTITWVRRDRLATDLEIPMSEAEEDYEVDILNSAGEVLRTISVSDTQAAYTEDQQITDFGSVQSEVTVRVYQISRAVGRGYPAEATV